MTAVVYIEWNRRRADGSPTTAVYKDETSTVKSEIFLLALTQTQTDKGAVFFTTFTTTT